MTSETPLDRELNQLWNDLVDPVATAGAVPSPPRGSSVVPADLADTVHRLHAMSRAPLPPAAHQHLARRRRHWAVPGDDAFPGNDGVPRATRLGPAHHRRPTAWAAGPDPAVATTEAAGEARRPRAAFGYVGTLVLLVCVGLIAIGLVRPHQPPGYRPEPPVFQLTLPAGTLPAGERVTGSLGYFTLNPGGAGDWTSEPGACCPGVRIDYLLTGELTVWAAAPALLFRANERQAPVTVRSGQAVVVTPGDVLLTRYDAAMTSRNTGTTPVGLLDLIVIDGFRPLIANPPGWTFHPDTAEVYAVTLPAHDIVMRLDAVTLAAGANRPLPPGAITQLGVTLVEALPLHGTNEGSITNPNLEAVTVHVVTLSPAPASE